MSNTRDDDAKRTVILGQGGALSNAPTQILNPKQDPLATANSKLPPTQVIGPGGVAPANADTMLDAFATVPHSPASDHGIPLGSGGSSTARPGYHATRLVMPGELWPSGQDHSAAQGAAAAPAAQPTPTDGIPVVGWLVVVGGPGRGKAVSIYYGNNSIGRDPDQKIVLDFGDGAISGKEQAFIRYNPRDRSFTLIPNNSKTNFVTVNDDAPMMPVVLQPFDRIVIGVTRLRFMPFCGPQFDWSDAEAQ